MKIFLAKIAAKVAALFTKLKNLHIGAAIKQGIQFIYNNGIAAGRAVLAYLKELGAEGILNISIGILSFAEIISIAKKGIGWFKGKKSKKTSTQAAMSQDMESKEAKDVIKEGADRFYKEMNAKEDIDTRLADLKDKLEKNTKGLQRRRQLKYIANVSQPDTTRDSMDMMEVCEIAKSYGLPYQLVYWLLWRDHLKYVGLTQEEIISIAKEAMNSNQLIYDLAMASGKGTRFFNYLESELAQYESLNDSPSWDDDRLLDYLYDVLIKLETDKKNLKKKPAPVPVEPRRNPEPIRMSMTRPQPAMAGGYNYGYGNPFMGGMPIMPPVSSNTGKKKKKGKK